MASWCGFQNPLHRAGSSVGERLLRVLQWKLRDELLNGEIFYSLKEARAVIEQWRKHYNTIRPRSALGHRPPAPQTLIPFPSPLDQDAQMQ